MDQEAEQKLAGFRDDFQRLREEVAKVIVGQAEIVDGMLVALVAGGHVLLEGVPGLGKTLLVRTLAQAIHARFSRIQFTPDLMPADLIGTNVMLEAADGSRRFEFQRGPVFANVLLADEINRATPKTQSALLEAMQEHSVTVGGQSHPLEGLFFVMATQNPLEMEGTYPLPEAQLDRFFYKLMVRFPTSDEVERILDRTTDVSQPSVDTLFESERLLEMGRLARALPLAESIRKVAVQIVMGTHPDHHAATAKVRKFVRFGSSPRGAQAVILAAKIHAILDGRFHVAIEDLAAVALPALRHRLILNFEGQAEGVSTDSIIEDAVQQATQAAVNA